MVISLFPLLEAQWIFVGDFFSDLHDENAIGLLEIKLMNM